MKKLLIAPAITLLLVGCGNTNEAPSLPLIRQVRGLEVNNILTSYNVNGYTKKTSFKFVDSIMEDTHYFHDGTNARERNTYYHVDEQMLLMGNADGTFSSINSGYRNKEGGVGIEHFTNTADTKTASNLFESEYIHVDWDYDEQRIGVYYPTLTSLGELLKESTWVEQDGVYTYSVTGLEIEEGDYNDRVLKNFQFFAAPMLLQTKEFNWSSIRFKEEEGYLSIKLYVTKGEEPVTVDPGESEEVVSEAMVYKGIHLQ